MIVLNRDYFKELVDSNGGWGDFEKKTGVGQYTISGLITGSITAGTMETYLKIANSLKFKKPDMLNFFLEISDKQLKE
jgi:hypothetical protein